MKSRFPADDEQPVAKEGVDNIRIAYMIGSKQMDLVEAIDALAEKLSNDGKEETPSCPA